MITVSLVPSAETSISPAPAWPFRVNVTGVPVTGVRLELSVVPVTPALLVPRPGPSAEQQMRARLFAERGWVDWLRPQDLNAAALGKAIRRALHRPASTAPVRPPDLSGRIVGSDRLIETLNETRSRPAPARAGPAG